MAKKRRINVPNSKQKFALANYLLNGVGQQEIDKRNLSIADLAELAQRSLGFVVTDTNVRYALNAASLSTPGIVQAESKATKAQVVASYEKLASELQQLQDRVTYLETKVEGCATASPSVKDT